MVSTLSRQEKFNQVRRNFCFYLDIQEQGLARSISRRLQDMGFQQEAFLSPRVTHVVRGRGARWRREPARARADAMLERARRTPQHNYVLLTVDKAITLLDKLFDTFCTAPRKSNVRLFSKHFIKIEFLDKPCRPLYKEFDAWPEISLEPNPPKDKRQKKESTIHRGAGDNNHQNTTQDRDMTRKNRPRIKEKEDKEPRGGYCEACGAEFGDLAAHARSPRHAAFVRDASNFLALDTLISAGGLLPGALLPALSGERRSLRNMCNGDAEPKPRAPRNGALSDERRRNTRCRKTADAAEDRQYYKVVGVSTKLRSSGGFVPKRKDSSPTVNGAKPLVVKFRKVRRSELSVLSDEAEQFMFPKRASSTSSTSSESEDEEPRRKTPPQPAPALERRRHARPLALKEESSEEDSWLDDKRRRKRKVAPVVRRTRRAPLRPPTPEPETKPEPEPEAKPEPEPEMPAPPPPEPEVVSPLREEPVEKCMKWEDGRLKYTPAVEQLEFAFECVPRSEPWFETFQRQDRDGVTVKNVPRRFALYSTSPKLPYEMGPLPPLKPNCCPLSALPRREGRPAGCSPRPATRGLSARAPLPRLPPAAAPRHSPREHASTRAILGSRRPHRAHEDAKSSASDDTASERCAAPAPPAPPGEAGERLRQFLSEVYEDADFDAPEPGAALPPAAAPPDVLGLVSDCDRCDTIRRHIREADAQRRAARRGRVKKKNRTGWPSKRKRRKGARADSSDARTETSLDRSSAASADTADAGALSDDADSADAKSADDRLESDEESQDETAEADRPETDDRSNSDDRPLRLDVKVLLEDEKDKPKAGEAKASSSVSESDEREEKGKKKKRVLNNLGSWLQPVVRVARVDPAAARRLRSAGAGPRARLR